MSLFSPVGPLIIVEGFRAEELAVEDLGLILDVVLSFLLYLSVETGLMHGVNLTFDHTLWLRFGRRDEIPLENFGERLAKLVSHDVPVPDLLVNSRIVDKCAIDRWLILRLEALLAICESISLTVITAGVVGPHHSIIHVL